MAHDRPAPASVARVSAVRAAVATARQGDRLHVATPRVTDTFRVTEAETHGDTYVLRLHRDGLPASHDVTVRYTSFWADAPATAPTLVVDGPDDMHDEQDVTDATVHPRGDA